MDENYLELLAARRTAACGPRGRGLRSGIESRCDSKAALNRRNRTGRRRPLRPPTP